MTKGNYTGVDVTGITSIEKMADLVDNALQKFYGFYLKGINENDRIDIQAKILKILAERKIGKKATIEIDMPDNCFMCQLCYKGHCTGFKIARCVDIETGWGRPDYCPLEPYKG